MTILDTIVARKEAEVRLQRSRLDADPEISPPPALRGFARALQNPGVVSLIAEFKRRSPSAGWIREGAGPEDVVQAYARGGAAALSVLTDRDFFGGSLDDLVRARSAVDLPVLRKDFIIDAVQIEEARAAGADAVLLIVRILEDAQLQALHGLARDAGLDVLVEVHDETELERALAADARIIGVNSRDLATFRTDLSVAERVAARVPDDVILVAESGISSAADVDRLGQCGVDAILVGESLMRSGDVEAAARQLAGRACTHRTVRR